MPEQSYERKNYTLFRYELVAPSVRNDGSESFYRTDIRLALTRAGFTGWTETDTTGFWYGKLEVGTTFILYAYETLVDWGNAPTESVLAFIARRVMAEQEAIQIVKYPHPVELIEG